MNDRRIYRGVEVAPPERRASPRPSDYPEGPPGLARRAAHKLATIGLLYAAGLGLVGLGLLATAAFPAILLGMVVAPARPQAPRSGRA